MKNTFLKSMTIVLLLSLGIVSLAYSQVTPIGTPSTVSATNTIIAYTVPAGSNRLLLVTASDAISTNIVSVTFGGLPLTEKIERNDGFAVDAIYTLNLGSGSAITGNIVITSSTSDNLSKVVHASAYANVNQSNPIGQMVAANNTTTPSSSSLTVTSNSGDLVFDIFDTFTSGAVASSHVAGTGQTFIGSVNAMPIVFPGNGFGWYSQSVKSGGSGPITMSRSTTNHIALIHIVVNIQQTNCLPTSNQSSITACNSYHWPVNGITYFTSGIYTHTSLNVSGCVHTEILNLTINQSTTNGSATITACNNYTWNGNTYTASGIYTHTSLNLAGCLNTATLQLTINAPTTNGNATITACNNYTWNGNTYTASGIYTHTSLNQAGCLNTATLQLTINTSTTNGNATVTACDAYTWNGNTYTTSGIYIHTSLNQAGCLNTATLQLTINTSTTNGNATITTCDAYTWNGITYTASGIYIHTSLNQAGCLNTATLQLTINISTTNGNATVTACDAYTWNGNTYTTTGVYTHTSLNQAGCLNTATLQLTISTSTTNGNATITACDAYTWNGNTYTTTGVYTHTSLNQAGCVNTAILQLTINTSTTNGNATVTACDAYTWNGNTYTTSGIYTHTSLNQAGCPNISTLQLTINTSTTNGNATITTCDAYIWNGNTYTTSGIYTHTSLNQAGCLNTATLYLSLHYSSDTTTYITANGCYVWAVNGYTYTQSGQYIHTSLNMNGCTHSDTLQLNLTSIIPLPIKVLLDGPYDSNTGLMHDSLRVLGLIPLMEPYTASPYNKTPVGFAGGETILPAVLNTSGSNAIVDWIFVELRNAVNPASVVANKRALIQRDGDIVDTDGISPLMINIAPGSYFVSVKHRNHLGVMTAAPVILSACMVNSIDFTLNSVHTVSGITNTPRKLIGGLYTLWSGDANNNKNTKYNGAANDKEFILTALGGSTNINSVITGYRMEDCNLDGKVRYNGIQADRLVVLSNVGSSSPNNIIFQHTPN